MKKSVVVIAVVVLLALIVGGMYVSSRNQMVVKNEAVKSAWAQVDVVLQRRADLIPNLVETVKGYAAQEQTVFHDIAAARSALMGAQTPQDKIAANGQLDGALSRLLVIVENYPTLKSNENFGTYTFNFPKERKTYMNDETKTEVLESLAEFTTRLVAQEAAIQDGISRLLEQRSRIEAADKRLANLHSQCLALRSSAALIQDALVKYRRAC